MAAFGVSASIFSLLTYLVIYVQNVLDYSAVGTGVRFLFLSGASFVAAAVAGRLTEKVPTKWLIAPASSCWAWGCCWCSASRTTRRGPTSSRACSSPVSASADQPAAGLDRGRRGHPRAFGHGLGGQLDLPPGRHRTGIAALGSIFGNQVADAVTSDLTGQVPDQALPVWSPRSRRSGPGRGGGRPGRRGLRGRGASAGQQAYDLVNGVGTSAVVDALNHITAIGAGIAFVSGVLCLLLIRQKDFVVHGAPPAEASAQQPAQGSSV